MVHICFGVLISHNEGLTTGAAHRLTRRFLALHQSVHSRYVESADLIELLEWASKNHFDAIVVQVSGHCILDNLALKRFVHQLVSDGVLLSANYMHIERSVWEVHSNILIVNIQKWEAALKPRIRLIPKLTGKGRQRQRINASLGLMRQITPEVRRNCLHLDAENPRLFRDRLRELRMISQKWCDQVWFVNTEEPEIKSCDSWSGPCHTLISVCAGFMPNLILHRLGLCKSTHIIFIDMSSSALMFRRWLLDNWDGHGYESAVSAWLAQNSDVSPWQHFNAYARDRERKMIEMFGGCEHFQRHWRRYRMLRHTFIQLDILKMDPVALLRCVGPSNANTAIWWSNVFHSLYTHACFSEHSVHRMLHRWAKSLMRYRPDILVYGQDDVGRPLAGRAREIWQKAEFTGDQGR